MKHWTEPHGLFIVNIPTNWQYRNVSFTMGVEEPPYIFGKYESCPDCFQLSCYPLAEKGVNHNFPIQKSNSIIQWFMIKKENTEFKALLFYAQVDDLLCMAKYIYPSKWSDHELKKEFVIVKKVLDSFCVIPANDRELAINLNKYDNFHASLIASCDLLNNAYESDSYIELVAILANQIDAFLRLSIVLKMQLVNETNNIEVEYLFQQEDGKILNERKIYKKALDLELIDTDVFKALNSLYDIRNRVIHRYIISYLKTREIIDTAYQYLILKEKIRLVLASCEKEQFGTGFGIYGIGYSEDYRICDADYKRLHSMANDKHLVEKLRRKIDD